MGDVVHGTDFGSDRPPQGYRVIRTDERIERHKPAIRWLKARALSYIASHPPLSVPSYHYRAERTHFWPVPRYAIVAYQNRLEKLGRSSNHQPRKEH